MTEIEKPYKSIDEQITLLKKRNLRFITEKSAKESLINYGYYEIINGYKHEFMLDPSNDEKGFKLGTNFEHIYSLYKLDHNIRDSMRESLENFEQMFKQSLSYMISRDISEDQTRYTAKSHYNAGRSHTYRRHGHVITKTDRDKLLNKTFKNILDSDFEPYNYYRNEHGNIPPWIMVKGLTFGATIYWFNLSKPRIREAVISRMIGLEIPVMQAVDSQLKIKRAFGDCLNLYLDYRNISSHGGRIYNHRSNKHKIRNYSPFIYQRDDIVKQSKRQFTNGNLRSSVGAVLRTLNMFENKDPYFNLEVMLEIHLHNHLKNYPQDFDFLMNEMELKNTFVEKTLLNEDDLELK